MYNESLYNGVMPINVPCERSTDHRAVLMKILEHLDTYIQPESVHKISDTVLRVMMQGVSLEHAFMHCFCIEEVKFDTLTMKLKDKEAIKIFFEMISKEPEQIESYVRIAFEHGMLLTDVPTLIKDAEFKSDIPAGEFEQEFKEHLRGELEDDLNTVDDSATDFIDWDEYLDHVIKRYVIVYLDSGVIVAIKKGFKKPDEGPFSKR